MKRFLGSAALMVLVSGALAAETLSPGAEFDGFFEPHQITKIASQAPGVLDAVLVKRGDIVKKGDVIAQFRSGVERATVDYFRAKVEFGSRKAGRNVVLAKRRLISANEKDELDTEAELSRLQYQEAAEKLRMRTVISPTDGVVVKRSHNPGEYVGEDDIATVATMDPLNIEVTVPVAAYGTIRQGMSAEVHPEAPVGGTYKATVTIVDRLVDAGSSTFGVRLELPNPDLKLPAGLKCKVKFQQ